MNLISCNECGVVLDKNKLSFPDVEDDGSPIDNTKAAWDGRSIVAKVDCPVCKSDVLESQ